MTYIQPIRNLHSLPAQPISGLHSLLVLNSAGLCNYAFRIIPENAEVLTRHRINKNTIEAFVVDHVNHDGHFSPWFLLQKYIHLLTPLAIASKHRASLVMSCVHSDFA